jgi:menaquinone-dependent protoporphyrinogen oxidase
MQNILIVYATREGQTEKVAAQVQQYLENANHRVRLVNAQDRAALDAIDLQAFDQLIFGASMHAGGLEKEIVSFINTHQDEIRAKERSFFLVLLSAATKDKGRREASLQEAANRMVEKLRVTFEDTEMIAGALMYSKYPLPVRWIMKRIARQTGEATDTSKDYEYTDWQQVKQYAMRLANAIPRQREPPMD